MTLCPGSGTQRWLASNKQLWTEGTAECVTCGATVEVHGHSDEGGSWGTLAYHEGEPIAGLRLLRNVP